MKDGFIFIEITQTFKGKPTKGGSSIFGVITTTDIVSPCSYEDHTNGLYTVKCPAYATHVHVNVKVLDVNYRQFLQMIRELDIEVFDKHISSSTILQKPREYWSQESHVWTRHSGIQQETKPSTDSVCKAVQKLDLLYMVGASHMRYYYHYLLAECRHLDPNFWRHLVYVEAIISPHISEFSQDLANKSLFIDCDKHIPFPVQSSFSL